MKTKPRRKFGKDQVLEKQPATKQDVSASSKARKAWAKFLDDVESSKNKLDFGHSEECWFRGQRADYLLLPSLHRLLKRKPQFNGKADHPNSIWKLEYDLYFESAARAPDLQHADLSSWDVLACMQHHGIPTRVLDWSENLGVAVFFALENYDFKKGEEKAPAIWLLNPYQLNEAGLGDRDLYSPRYLGYERSEDDFYSYEDYLVFEAGYFDWDLPVAIYQPQKHIRMRSQMGWFTIWGERNGPLDKQYPKCAKKLVIPEEAVPAAKEFLMAAGIDYSTIYPGLDGFAKMLRGRYGI